MSITAYRRVTQVAFILLIFLLPVLNILRFDSATRELIIFGHVWGLGLKEGFYADRSAAASLGVALQFLIRAILPWIFVLAIFPLFGLLSGRFFCGWLCPEGALFELADFLTSKLIGRRSLFAKKPNDPDAAQGGKAFYTGIALLSAVIIPVSGGIALTGYFVAPQTIWHQITQWEFTFGVKAGIIGVSIYMVITSIFVRHLMCKYVCAAGLMQMLFGWVSPVSMRLKMDVGRASECTNCQGCDKACFMGVVPRKQKRDVSCINCGACIDACNKELGHGKGLFHYGFGEGVAAGRGGETLRRAPSEVLKSAANKKDVKAGA